MQEIIFWFFASVATIAALLVCMLKNPVRAILALIVTFVATAATWLMLEAEFLAVTLVLVYVGAVMVLMLFVIMMLDIKVTILQNRFNRWLPIGLSLAIALLITVYQVVIKSKLSFVQPAGVLSYAPTGSNTELLGMLVFTDYLLQFVLAGVLLLVAIIAAIVLIYRGPHGRKIQRPELQVLVQAKNRVRLVDGV